MAPLTVYIDAYNVLHKIPRLASMLKSDGDAARRAFVEHIRTQVPARSSVVCVFDGNGEHIASGTRITCVFSFTRSADAWIRARLENVTRPHHVLVISSDTEVRSHAAAMGAATQRAEDFLAAVEARSTTPTIRNSEKNRVLSAPEIEEWLRVFESGREAE